MNEMSSPRTMSSPHEYSGHTHENMYG